MNCHSTRRRLGSLGYNARNGRIDRSVSTSETKMIIKSLYKKKKGMERIEVSQLRMHAFQASIEIHITCPYEVAKVGSGENSKVADRSLFGLVDG